MVDPEHPAERLIRELQENEAHATRLGAEGFDTLASVYRQTAREKLVAIRAYTPAPAAPPAPSPSAHETLETWSDERLASALLSYLCRSFDAGGISHGRSWWSRLAETARDVLDAHRPLNDINEWPAPEDIVRVAENRRSARYRVQSDERRMETDALAGFPWDVEQIAELEQRKAALAALSRPSAAPVAAQDEPKFCEVSRHELNATTLQHALRGFIKVVPPPEFGDGANLIMQWRRDWTPASPVASAPSRLVELVREMQRLYPASNDGTSSEAQRDAALRAFHASVDDVLVFRDFPLPAEPAAPAQTGKD